MIVASDAYALFTISAERVSILFFLFVFSIFFLRNIILLRWHTQNHINGLREYILEYLQYQRDTVNKTGVWFGYATLTDTKKYILYSSTFKVVYTQQTFVLITVLLWIL